jgi:dienelactone hydrolase
MGRVRFACAGAIMLCIVGHAVAPASATEAVSVPVEYQGHMIELPGRFDKPAGPGPFPAVILLHGCSGYKNHLSHMIAWAQLLVAEGYATFLVDSFTPRGYYDCMTRTAPKVPTSLRGVDLYAAAYVLAGRPDIRGDRIASLGFSQGGGTSLAAAAMAADWRSSPARGTLLAAAAETYGKDYAAEVQRLFKTASDKLATRGKLTAFIALYPGLCGSLADDSFGGPVLLLIGTADAEVSYPDCARLGTVPRPRDPELRFKAYPGASHSFDWSSGDYTRGFGAANRPAAADAREEVKSFLRRYLQ